MLIFGRADFTAAVIAVGTLEPFDQLLAHGNIGNTAMSTRQDWTFGSTTTADNIFLGQHNVGLSPLLGGTDITQMIT